MISRRLEWAAPDQLVGEIREFLSHEARTVDVTGIADEVASRGDEALIAMTRRFDAPEADEPGLRVSTSESRAALERLDPEVRRALEISIANVRQVAEAQLVSDSRTVNLPQGQTVTVGEVPLGSAGIYAPGGRASS